MGYLHIENLYKNNVIQLFRECYALEKIHGTSAHISLRRLPLTVHDTQTCEIGYFSGGASYDSFVKLFDAEKLLTAFALLGHEKLTIYGEAYGGSMQGMKHVYGSKLKFVAFDVKHGADEEQATHHGTGWLSVPDAADLCAKLGLDFVPFEKVITDTAVLDAERSRPSRQATKNGVEGFHVPEGVVLRPLIELNDHRGNRIIAKHKNAEFSERKSGRDTQVDPEKALKLAGADAIAAEWVTPMRLTHVLDKLDPKATEMKDVPRVVTAMWEDVTREGAGEFEPTKDVQRAVSALAVKLYKKGLVP